MAALRIALLGAGLIGARHARYVRECEDTELVAVCDPLPVGAKLATANGARWYDNMGALFDTMELDGAIVATPTKLHEAHARECAARGIAMLVEKPIAHDVVAANRIVAATGDAGVALLVGHHRRYNPAVTEARRLIRDGELGQLINISGQWSVLKPDDYFEPEWRRLSGGGPVLINLIHDIDTLRHLCGEVVRVYAESNATVRGFEVEDSVSLTLRFESGAMAAVTASDATPSPWTWEQGTGESAPMFPESSQNSFRFMGTNAALEFPRLTLWKHGSQQGWNNTLERHDVDVPQVDVYAEQIAHFARVIRGEEAPRIAGADAARTLATTLAVIESARTGLPVDLGL